LDVRQVLNRAFFLFVVMMTAHHIAAAPPRGKGGGNGTRLYLGGAYGIYDINRRHASDASTRTSICAGFRRELRADRMYHAYVLFGAEYFMHGVRFNSYYFYADSTALYNRSFAYTYALRIHELCVPAQFKYVFKRADNNLNSPYIAAGYQLRLLVTSGLVVDRGGEVIRRDYPRLKFRHPLFIDPLNSGVQLAVGWQRNQLSSGSGGIFVEMNLRYGFSQYYFEAPYAATSLFINSVHVAFVLGARF
jgi:hypothetical protein